MIDSWIFDFDDTLVSGGGAWKTAETELIERLGGYYDPDIAASYRGLNAIDVATVICRGFHQDSEAAARHGAVLRARLIELAARSATAMPGATELLRRISAKRRVVIASGSPSEAIAGVVDVLGWREYVEFWVSSESVPAGKPEPDVFLETCRRLGTIPERCLVVEDSIPGVEAAMAAGMRCIAVPSRGVRIEEIPGKRRLAESLDAIDIEVERWFDSSGALA